MGGPRPRERILVAATRLFADEGIQATSVDRVIAEAGVAPMTVYRHFAGKDELVTATLERWSQVSHSRLQRSSVAVTSSSVPAKWR